MKEIIAYEMSFKKEIGYRDEVFCIPFKEIYWNEYMQKYNECFYEMRKDLQIEPINFYSDYSQMIDKASNTYLCLIYSTRKSRSKFFRSILRKILTAYFNTYLQIRIGL